MRRGRRFDDAGAALDSFYAEGITDEFVIPCILGDYAGVEDGDVLVVRQFPRRPGREISTALLAKGFDGFARQSHREFGAAAGLTNIPMP